MIHWTNDQQHGLQKKSLWINRIKCWPQLVQNLVGPVFYAPFHCLLSNLWRLPNLGRCVDAQDCPSHQAKNGQDMLEMMRPWPKDDKNLLAQIFRAFSKTTLKTSENSLSTLKLHIAKPIGSMYAIYGNMDPINIPPMLALKYQHHGSYGKDMTKSPAGLWAKFSIDSISGDAEKYLSRVSCDGNSWIRLNTVDKLYPLVNVNKKLWKITIVNGKIHEINGHFQ